MLDLKFVREHLDEVRRKVSERGLKIEFGPIRELESDRRRLLLNLEELRQQRNVASRDRSGTSTAAAMRPESHQPPSTCASSQAGSLAPGRNPRRTVASRAPVSRTIRTAIWRARSAPARSTLWGSLPQSAPPPISRLVPGSGAGRTRKVAT